mgnify:CR=1 FL=1
MGRFITFVSFSPFGVLSPVQIDSITVIAVGIWAETMKMADVRRRGDGRLAF